MANSIDQLGIEISASSTQASNSIDQLIGRLQKLQSALNGVNTKTLNSRLSQTSNIIKSFGGSSTKSSAEMQRNMYAMSYSLDRLGSGLERANGKVNAFFGRIRSGAKETKNFAQTVGLLYARFFVLIRSVKLLGKAIKSSMSYIETLNYFESAFQQVADQTVSGWTKAGYESAEAYADSFKERAKQVTADMTGFLPSEDGSLTATNEKSLGLNSADVLKYQAQFAQMSSSMGVASDKATLLSEVLVKIGSDLASVKDMDFNDVWGDMASGLVGMSRTLDKYGVNIRNANMQQELARLGINTTVSALGQQDKALLRTIILLNSTKYAWGDLAETLNTPANQMRILSANIQQLGRIIGNLFLPIIAKVLPYINGLVIALQRLFTWIGSLLGLDLSGLTSNKGYDNSGISDLLDDADNLADGLDDANGEAKKLKNTILGFDELNVLNAPNEDSGKGKVGGVSGLLDDAFLDAVDDYLKAWEEAFKKLEDKAKAIADKICAFFKRLFAPVLEAFAKYGDWIKEKWSKAFKSIGKLLKDIGRDFWKVWESPETQKIFDNLVQMLGQVGLFVGKLADKIREAWNYNDNGLRILTAIRDILGIIVQHFKNIADSLVLWVQELNLEPLLSSLAQFMEDLKPVFDAIYGVFEDFVTDVLEPLAKWTLEKGLPELFDVLDRLVKKIDWEKLRRELKKLWEHLEPFAERVGEGLIKFIEDVGDRLANWINNGGFENFLERVENFLDSISSDDVKNIMWGLVNAIIALKGALLGFKLAKGFTDFLVGIETLKRVLEGGALVSSLEGLAGAFTVVGTAMAVGTFAKDEKEWVEALDKYGKTGGKRYVASVKKKNANPYLNGKALFQEDANWNEKLLGKDWSWENPFAGNGGGGHSRDISATTKAVESLTNALTSLKSKFEEVGNSAYIFVEQKIKPFFTQEKWDAIYNTIVTSLQTKWGELVEWWNTTGFSAWWNDNVVPWFSYETWYGLYTTILTALQTKWAELVEWWNSTAIYVWWTENVAPWFTYDKWYEMYTNIRTALEDLWNELVEWWSSSTLVVWWDEHVAPWFTKEKWSELFAPIKEALQEKWNEASSWWKTNIASWFEREVIPKFTNSKWSSILKGVPEAFKTKFGEALQHVTETVKKIYSTIVEWVEKAIEKVKELIAKLKEAREMQSSSGGGSRGFFSSSIGSLNLNLKLPTINLSKLKFANGGFPEDGLFFANHNELVGGFSNGKTAVANNEQITTGIKNAVYEAMMSVMASSDGFGRGDVIVNAVLKTENDEVLARAVERGQQQLTRRYNPVY